MSDLKPCKVCGLAPHVFETNIHAHGTAFRGWVVECTFDEEDYRNPPKVPPFVDHTLEVYGATKEQATERWEQLND
ncbi:hypothetical protein VPHD480_0108 [Vibrio phage D480]